MTRTSRAAVTRHVSGPLSALGRSSGTEPVGLSLVVVAALLWGTLGLFGAALLDRGIAPAEIAFWRAAFGGGAFLVHAALTRTLSWPRAGVVAPLATLALVGVAGFYLALAKAIDEGGISLAFVLLYTAPAWVTALAGPFLGERTTWVQWTWVVGAMVGVTLVSQARGTGVDPSFTAIAWGLAAGLGYASYYLVGKRLLTTSTPASVYGLALPLGAVALAPFVGWSSKDAVTWLLLMGVAFVCTYLAYLAYGLGLQRTTASRAVLVATIEPVVAAGLAAWVFGERMGLWGWAGAGVVVLCAAAAGLQRTDAQAP
jgi:drug/metabolite transporter (DMT)-like permease